MIRRIAAAATILCAIAPPLAAQPNKGPMVISRMVSVYRGMQSYRDSATWTRRLGDTTYTADITLAMQRPNKYAFEMKGAQVNTVVWSDGMKLTALRPDRKAYIQSRAPNIIMRSNVLNGIDIPSPGARIISLLLQGNVSGSDDPLAKAILAAEYVPPANNIATGFHRISFTYDMDWTANVDISDKDYMIRNVTLLMNKIVEVSENHSEIEVDKPIPSETFSRPLPAGAVQVSSLPKLETVDNTSTNLKPAPDFKLSTATAIPRTLELQDYRGRFLVLAFFDSADEKSGSMIASLVRIHTDNRDKALSIVGISTSQGGNDLTEFLDQYKPKFPITINRSTSDAEKDYKITELPTCIVINREGKIIARVTGHNKGDTRVFRALRKAGLEIE